MGELHDNVTAALMLHRYFLQSEENRRKFFITEPEFYPFDYTINVNFVAIRGEDFHKTFELILEMLEREKRYYDEGAIAHDAIQKGYKEGIYMHVTRCFPCDLWRPTQSAQRGPDGLP